MKGINYTRQAC